MTTKWRTLRRAMVVLPLLFTGLCWSQTALIVHDGTAGIEADAVGNLSAKLVAAGYTVTTNSASGLPSVPVTGYRQVWDVRFNTTTPLDAPTIAAYVAYMAAGGSLFVMGENTGFAVRNNSIVSLIQAAGGGIISVTTPADTETVQTPFTGPNALTTITFLAAAGTGVPGTGAFITRDGGNPSLGAALVFSPTRMSNAPAGTLIVVFDVNFLQASADANSQTFTNNLIAYLGAPTVVVPPVTVPTLSEWAMILLAFGLILVASRRLLKRGPAAAGVSAT